MESVPQKGKSRKEDCFCADIRARVVFAVQICNHVIDHEKLKHEDNI